MRTKAQASDRLNVVLRSERAAVLGVGTFDPPHVRDKIKERRNTLLKQSHEMAGIFEKLGFKSYRFGNGSLWRYLVHTGEVESVPLFARTCFIPWAAAQIRAQNILAAEYYLEMQRLILRFWTFTSGPRCQKAFVRQRLEQLHRKISRFNAWLKRNGWPVEIVMRASELGSFHRKGGNYWYHPHAHCIVLLREALDDARWDMLLRKVRAFWKNNWDEGGRIRSVKAAIRYIAKPADLITLGKESPMELAGLVHALRGLKMVQPMGYLRRSLTSQRRIGIILERRITLFGTEWLGRLRRKRGDDLNSKRYYQPFDSIKPDCYVIGVSSRPVSNSLGIREAAVLFSGSREGAGQLATHPLVVRLRDASNHAYEAGLTLFRTTFWYSSALRVHMCTPTVPSLGKDQLPWMSPHHPGGGTPPIRGHGQNYGTRFRFTHGLSSAVQKNAGSACTCRPSSSAAGEEVQTC